MKLLLLLSLLILGACAKTDYTEPVKTVMGCSPATGCGTYWLNNCDQLCYTTSTGGPACSRHTKCY